MTTNEFISHIERLKPDMLLALLAIASEEEMSFRDVVRIMFDHSTRFSPERLENWERSVRPANL